MREDPIDGEAVTLAVRVETDDAESTAHDDAESTAHDDVESTAHDDAESTAHGAGERADETVREVERALEAAGVTVAERLPYGTLRVETTQNRIDDICSIAHIASIETATVLEIGGDAGEDV